jgi:hypothetical protein
VRLIARHRVRVPQARHTEADPGDRGPQALLGGDDSDILLVFHGLFVGWLISADLPKSADALEGVSP